MSAAILLTRGHVALVSLADLSWLAQWKWTSRVSKGGGVYGRRNVRFYDEKTGTLRNRTIHLHNEVYKRAYGPIPPGAQIDHKNRDSLNTQRSNLRAVSPSLNVSNRGYRRTESLPRGAYVHGLKFVAQIRINGKTKYLGTFATVEKAAEAFNERHKEIYGNK